jgi:excisionase family DNA binding protein
VIPHADLFAQTHDDDRPPAGGDAPPRSGLPDFLTVVEAARVLRIGRTSAYQLAQQWCDTDGRQGLPVVRVGRLLRVPRHALERLAGGDLSTAPPAASGPSPSTASPGRDQQPTRPTPQPPSHSTPATTRARRGQRDDRGPQASLFPADR